MFLTIIIGLALLLLLLIFLSIKSNFLDKKREVELHKMLEEATEQAREKADTLAKLEAQNKNIETKDAEQAELKKLNDKLKTEMAVKDKQLGESHAKLKENLSTLERQVNEIRQVKENMKKKEMEFASLNETYSSLKEKYDVLSKQVQEIQSLKSLLEKKDAELLSLNEAYNGLKEQYDDLGRDLSEINQEKATQDNPTSLQKSQALPKTDKTVSDESSADNNLNDDGEKRI